MSLANYKSIHINWCVIQAHDLNQPPLIPKLC